MAKYKLTVDGKSYQVTADTPEAAHSALMKHLGRTPKQETNLITQSMSGLNEGLANLAGLPVDMVTGGLNLASKGINRATGVDLGQIKNPVGGSQGLLQEDGMGAFVTDVPPQTTAQRVGRRVGQEVGASLPMAAAILGRTATAGGGVLNEMTRAAQANPGRYAAAEAAGAIGSGGGAAIANEAFPDNQTAEMLGQILGGGVGVMAASPRAAKAPTVDDIVARQKAAYGAVDASPIRLTNRGSQKLTADIAAAAQRGDMDAGLHPTAARVAEKIPERLQGNPTIGDVERTRRLISRNPTASLVPEERRIGKMMRDALDTSMSDILGNAPVAKSLREARAMTTRLKKYEALEKALYGKELDTATSGRGGNLINNQRRAVANLLKKEKNTGKFGFSPDEVSAMESFSKGTTTQNFLRLAASLSPTTGALPTIGMAAAAGGTMAATGSPGMVAASLIPSTIGAGAKAAAEGLAKKDMRKIAELILRGAPADTGGLTPAQKAIILSLTSGGVANANAQ